MESSVSQFLVSLGLALLLLAGVGIAGYFLLRRLFDRIADRMADRIERAAASVVTRAAATPFGRRTGAAVRTAAGRVTRLDAYAAAEGISSDEARRQFAESIARTARLMDSAIRVPVVGPVGFDAILGIVPVVGDATAAVISISMIAKSLKYGVPDPILARMLTNVLFDLLLGAVPLVGDVADLWFRSNTRNLRLLQEYLAEEARNTIDVTPTRTG